MLAAYSIASETATINHHHPHLPAAVAAHLQHQQLQHHLNKQQQQQQQVQSHHQALLAANPIAANPSAALAVIAAAKNVNSQPQQVSNTAPGTMCTPFYLSILSKTNQLFRKMSENA